MTSSKVQTQTRIPLFSPKICEEAVANVSEVLRSGWLGLGPKTKAFEDEFAIFTGSRHCVGVNSATSALHLALHVLDMPEGSEVISTSLTFVSTNHAIMYERCKPVFADIDPQTGNLDIDSVREKITDKTKAIILVHFGGYPNDLDEFYALAKEHNLTIIEDCAHAAGSAYKGNPIGSHADLACFSFHAVKNLPMGDGGALTCKDPEIDARLRRLRWLGINADTFSRTGSKAGTEDRSYKWEYRVDEVGFKYHMNDIMAAIGLAQLPLLAAENERRNEIAKLYRAGLEGVPGLDMLQYKDDRYSSCHIFCVKVDNRNGFADKLRESNIDTGVHYKPNDHYPVYERAHLPNVDAFWERAVSLPMNLRITDEQVQYVIDTIRSGW